MPYLRIAPVVLTLLLLAVLTGCLPAGASFSPGFGTGELQGQIDLPPPDPESGPPLIVVYKHHNKLIGFDGERTVTHPTVHVASVGEFGQYAISMPADVTSLDVFFIAPDRLTDVFHFDRQLGVGTVTYRARLPLMRDWRSHFYTYLEPELEHLIVEGRYNLSAKDSETLTHWLNDQKHRLERGSTAQRGAAQRPLIPAGRDDDSGGNGARPAAPDISR